MGKRSNFERRDKDFYPTTDPKALRGMADIWRGQGVKTFAEPCAGDGALMDLLHDIDMICVWQSDIAPQTDRVEALDGFNLKHHHVMYCDAIITNPPWSRPELHALIQHFQNLRPTWLLFDADWMHTKQAVPFLDQCSQVVSVGRLKWIPDSPHTGKDNCAWYCFDAAHRGGPRFFGQQIAEAA